MPLDLNRQRTFVSEVLIALMRDKSYLNTKDGFELDCAEIVTRMDGEGLPFATSTLPSLGKALERSLETGFLEVPAGFATSKRSPGLPCFLQDVLAPVFDHEGHLRPYLNWIDVVVEFGDETERSAVKAAAEAVKFVRQLCYLGYKLELPRDEQLDNQFIESWVAKDEDLPEPDDPSEPSNAEAVRREFTRLLDGVDPRDIKPRHGPGAVATGERGEEKWTFKRHHPHLADLYDLTFFTVGGERELADRPEWFSQIVKTRSKLKLGPCSKMILVHKDARGPRMVCPEELELMYLQQGLADAIKRSIQRVSMGRVQFADQTINGRLALLASLSRKDATLDLKDASDLVSLWAVRIAARGHLLLPYLEALRSVRVMLPNGKFHLGLRKFAPMGSALCFPIEAALFYSIAVAAIASLLPGRLRWIRRHVHVYGDDIIVPREYAACVMDALEAWHLKVNRTKSFVHGFFRESCGVDAFAGENVTPVKLKKLLPLKGQDSVSEIASLTRTALLFIEHGYPRAGEIAYRTVEEHIGPLPRGVKNSGFLCRVVSTPEEAEQWNVVHSYGRPYCPKYVPGYRTFKGRYNDDLQRYEYLTFSVRNIKKKTVLDGWQRLLKNLLSGASSDPDQVVDLNQPIVLNRTWNAI